MEDHRKAPSNPLEHLSSPPCGPGCPACAYERGRVEGQLEIACLWQFSVDHYNHDFTGTNKVRELRDRLSALQRPSTGAGKEGGDGRQSGA
jgi:hypothetical protein